MGRWELGSALGAAGILGGGILQAEDIEGLLDLGAPRDEYSNEPASIATALESGFNEDHVYGLVVRVWNRSFGPFDDDDLAKCAAAFHRVAGHIARLLT